MEPSQNIYIRVLNEPGAGEGLELITPQPSRFGGERTPVLCRKVLARKIGWNAYLILPHEVPVGEELQFRAGQIVGAVVELRGFEKILVANYDSLKSIKRDFAWGWLFCLAVICILWGIFYLYDIYYLQQGCAPFKGGVVCTGDAVALFRGSFIIMLTVLTSLLSLGLVFQISRYRKFREIQGLGK